MKSYFNQEEEVAFVPIITDAEGGLDLECPDVDEENLPILPLRNMTLFPGITLPVLVGRRTSLALVKEAFNNKKYIGVVCQKKADIDDPAFDDIYYMGSIAEIVKILDMPDGNTTVILQGKRRFKLLSLTNNYPYLKGKVELVDEIMTKNDNPEFMGLVSALKDLTGEFLKNLGDPSRELLFAVQNIGNPYFLINFLSANLPISIERKQALLAEDSIKERGVKLYAELSKETQFQEIKARIQSKTREDISQQQREHFLQQQIKTIQEELGETQEQDISELMDKASSKNWSQEVAAIFEKELRKLQRLYPQTPDFSVQYNYLETFVELPWNEYTCDNFDLKNAFLAYGKVNSQISWTNDRYSYQGETVAKVGVRGRTLCLYLALNPDEYPSSVYHQKFAGDTKMYEKTPMMVKIKSKVALKRALRLVEMLMETLGAVKEDRPPEDFSREFAYRSEEQLLAEGLIKTALVEKTDLDF